MDLNGKQWPTNEEFFIEVDKERSNQNQQWGGPEHDDNHEELDWLSFINKQISKAGLDIFDRINTPSIFQERMIKVAALAKSAYESSRRQEIINPKHFETKE